MRVIQQVNLRSADYLGFLEKGQLPPARLTLTSFQHQLVLEGQSCNITAGTVCPSRQRMHAIGDEFDLKVHSVRLTLSAIRHQLVLEGESHSRQSVFGMIV